MKQSKRKTDEWFDQMMSGQTIPDTDQEIRALLGLVSADAEQTSELTSTLVGVLAQEALATVSKKPRGLTRSHRPLTTRWRRRTMITTFLSTLLGKLLIGTAAIAMATTGLAAADALPDAAQEWVSEAADRVGMNLPNPADASSADTPEAPELPENASDTAKDVTSTIFGDDPGEGADFGGNIADTASDGKGDSAGTTVPEHPTGDSASTTVPEDPAGDNNVSDEHRPSTTPPVELPTP